MLKLFIGIRQPVVDAVRVTVPVPQRETSEETGGAGAGLMIAWTAVRVALRHVFPASA